MAACPRYAASAWTAQKTPLPNVMDTEPMPSKWRVYRATAYQRAVSATPQFWLTADMPQYFFS